MKFRDDTCELDAIDARLLTELQADAKLSLTKLGESVGLSAPAVMERVRKLESAGVIKGYHAIVDGRRVGLDIASFIGVSIRDPKLLAEFEEHVHGMPQVLECHHVTGGYALLLKVKVRNTGALEQLIRRIRSFHGVEGTETMVVLSTHTERVQVALEVDEEELADLAGRRKKKRGRKAS